ncbi:MAG TPA: c-type cytochrome [Pyrinomonadaceae bacterium]|nr:c-type cytochrome [Pyrinomonadaceae bacterium]
MADTPETDKLVKREPEPPPKPDGPAPDPITRRTTSSILLISALLLTGVLAWSLWDEVYGQRPWKDMQESFAKRYERYLKRVQRRGFQSEREVKESAEYQELERAAVEAENAVKPQLGEIDRKVKAIDEKLAAVTDPFQDKRGRITVINYSIEVSDEDDKADLRKEADELRQEKVRVRMPDGDGRTREERLNYAELERVYNELKGEKAGLLVQRGELLKDSIELRRKRDEYLKDNITQLSEQQVASLRNKNNNFEVKMRQISVRGDEMVDRCETCHLGIREPIDIRPADMMSTGRRNRPDRFARAFVSHPSRELLQIHDPEKFGCSSCHGGNGRATTSVVKGHGRHRFWLHPLHERDNMEAGCQQCHTQDRVLQGAPMLTKGKDLFQERGCVGCHRYEGFDRESDALTNTRQLLKQLDDERIANEREAKKAAADSGTASDEEADELLRRAESLRVTNSQIEARIDQLEIQSRHLMQDQKKVGPNLKDVRLKLRKEWIPEWLRDPQAFRPGTKMPTYWYLSGEKKGAGNNIAPSRQEEERKAISAYLWQSAFEGQLPRQPAGDGARGKELFETRGCLACHSIGEGDAAVGGEFAANLQKMGEKANYEYVVRWIHNPRERTAPYCPKERRDLTPEDYAKAGKPYLFDSFNSKCPNDGSELQVQNMTVMPNFRLTDADARDIATYLMSLSQRGSYPDASYMDDPALAQKGQALIKSYGCAGCHEIRGFEEEQRIGKELSTEGSTPIERLDFALLTHKAERGEDPFAAHGEGGHAEGSAAGGTEGAKGGATGAKRESHNGWYNHRGFIEYKLEDPSIYDMGKEKEPQDHLRMPDPFLKPEWKTALTTFLLGSVGTEGANVPTDLFYNPTNLQKDIQDGWWVIKKYNCMGCHNIQVGQKSVLSGMDLYKEGGALGTDQLPPGLMTEGARVDPDWLLRFLRDPSLSGRDDEEMTAPSANRPGSPTRPDTNPQTLHGSPGGDASQQGGALSPSGQPPNTAGQPPNAAGGGGAAANAQRPPGLAPGPLLRPQPGEDKNGVRTYLRARMPTFNFSPNELRTLVRFFLAVSSQQEPYIKERLEPLTAEERGLARALFTSQAAPCLKCHLTGNAEHDKTANAPNFLQAGERLKPDWTWRWLLDPQRIMPGTAMPSNLFKREGERWVFNGPLPPGAENYTGDHARLLVRYMLQLTPQEQQSIAGGSRVPATSGSPPAPAPTGVASSHNGLRPSASHRTTTTRERRASAAARGSRGGKSARASAWAGKSARRGRRVEASRVVPRRARRESAALAQGAGRFSP